MEDEWALPRARELAAMVFGEDLEEAAGDTLDKHWLHVSSPLHCGKMDALQQLLHLWASSGGNKVTSMPFPPQLPSGFHHFISPRPTTLQQQLDVKVINTFCLIFTCFWICYLVLDSI